MTTLDRFDHYLGEGFSRSYWGEVGVERAAEIAAGLSSTEWNELRQAWKSRHKEWRLRFADVISEISIPFAVSILIEMITGLDDELALVAADSLRVMPRGPAPLELEPVVVARLRDLANRNPGVTARTIEDLLSQASHS